MMNQYDQNHEPKPMYDNISRHGQPMLHHWTSTEAMQNIAQYKGQYIRTSITGFGVVYAQLTDYNPTTGTVDLNVYFTPGRPPQFMQVNRKDLTAIVPLGYQPPPEILAPPPMQMMQTMSPSTMSSMPPQRCDWVRWQGRWVWACW